MAPSFLLQPLDETRRETGPVQLVDFPCTVGRGRDCELRLNLQRISRRHLKVTLESDGVLIEDLGSTNGTFINEERIDVATRLKPGDHLHLADYAFRLEKADDPDPSAGRRAGRPETLAGQTIAGFTEESSGFPVQAPQFYDLLNEGLLEPLAIEARLGADERAALLIAGRSTHTALNASHDRLAHMARQLGEEARYHGMLREMAVEAADRADLDGHLLLLPIDAYEVEDASVLLHELGELAGRYRRLDLACVTDSDELDGTTLEQLDRSLRKLGLQLAVRSSDATTGGNAVERVATVSDAVAQPISEIL